MYILGLRTYINVCVYICMLECVAHCSMCQKRVRDEVSNVLFLIQFNRISRVNYKSYFKSRNMYMKVSNLSQGQQF